MSNLPSAEFEGPQAVSASPRAGRIWLVRHGQTDWNTSHRFQGSSDIPLNDTGREQVRGALDTLRTLPIDAVVSSPLQRAAQSGQIIARGLGVPYAGSYAGVQEMCFGQLEGQVATPELVALARAGKGPGSEGRTDFIARALVAFNRIRVEHPGKNIAVATHGLLISATMTALLGHTHPDKLGEEGTYPIPPNAAITELPVELLDAAIDRYAVRSTEPGLGAEALPQELAKGSLILVRHGQTDWNKASLMQGVSDIPLNDTGRGQAVQAGDRIAALPVDAVVSSPLSRAQETADIIAGRLHLPNARTYSELVERNYGAGEGINMPAMERAAPDRYYPGVESEYDLYIRGVRGLRRIVREHPGQRVVVVSHGSLIRRVAQAASGVEIPSPVPNAQPLEVNIAGLFAWESAVHFS